jgi:hypothetical protein
MTTEIAMTREEQELVVERILASVLFRKSHRLSSFLRFVCEQHQLGKAETINEQHIGTAVFGRSPGYHVGEDSIVRSQARFLRQKLQEYYATEGREETILLTIPKGSYLPAFQYRESTRETITRESEAVSPPQAPELLLPATSLKVESETAPRRFQAAFQPRKIAILVATVAVIALLVWFRGPVNIAHAKPSVESRFWASIFDPKRTQIIVPADSSLILMEELSGRRVEPTEYMSRKYLEVVPPPGTEALWETLRSSQYTNMADLNLASRLERRPEASDGKVQIRYARDLSLKELKETNAILIGGARANPWVDLFDSFGRLRVDYDWKTHTNFVSNRMPAAGEQARYEEVGSRGAHVAYGVIAYVPSLDSEGSTLMVGGTSKAGTEAAAEFLFNSGFSAFLHSIDSEKTLPYFEILLSTENFNGDSHHGTIVCFHRLQENNLPKQGGPE